MENCQSPASARPRIGMMPADKLWILLRSTTLLRAASASFRFPSEISFFEIPSCPLKKSEAAEIKFCSLLTQKCLRWGCHAETSCRSCYGLQLFCSQHRPLRSLPRYSISGTSRTLLPHLDSRGTFPVSSSDWSSLWSSAHALLITKCAPHMFTICS
jgi:hypothetical protein